MTRDFAKKPRPKTKRRSRAARSTVPAWVWLFTGAVLGAFIMFLTYLSGLAPTADPTQPSVAGAPGDAATTPKPRFDFYQLLKESEVKVDAKPLPPVSERPDFKSEFIIQVASFDSHSRADRTRAELILLNLEASIEATQVRGKPAYRVMVGPFLSKATLDQARGILISNDYKPLTRTRKTDG
ncbi:carbamoyl-phosphate synthase small subunit [Exilibacterium tricleocarpae]|uniref:Carbamoyl-phosphate synthase small subunit n=1 Tax=Exilibacterium tricleocarpae TaxID=2591008 RepID=A0A545T605_9GAMM|nr:SPOR domain-containing protein [Exilibacterium tricleocarpae]TQV72661.1 carbamoyl-phosphate synthase small subunit [Exilibacterium tricleocarpae]